MEYRYSLIGSEESREGPRQNYYICSLKNLQSKAKHWQITLNKAKHVSGKGKSDVEAVVITESTIHFMPNNLDKHFGCLRAVEISNCDLCEITDVDMRQFKLQSVEYSFLKELHLSNNKIESLSADLFFHTRQLNILVLRNNRIKYIHQDTLEPLTNLMHADFRGNININEIYSGNGLSTDSVTLSVLNAKIALHCKPADESVVASYIHSLWRGDFSDFDIKAGENVFKVHKAILAVNSPIFAAMFSHNMDESVMEIKNFLSETVKEFLAFVYLRQIPKKCFNALELYAMSEEYQNKQLSQIIQWFIVLEINAENASEMVKLGALLNNNIIKEAAFQQIEKNFNKKLPKHLMDSVEGMADILKAMEILKRVLQM